MAFTKAYRHGSVSGSVCPVFGCISLAFNNGHLRFNGGVELAVGYPAINAGYEPESFRRSRRWSSSNSVFGGSPIGGASWDWEGQNARKGRGSWFLAVDVRKPTNTGYDAWGGGYVHTWGYTL